MGRRKIALLVAQGDEEYQSDFVRGAMKKAFSEGVDVYVFSMYIKYQNTAEREVGDANIYNLINYSNFDGVIILSDMIQTQGVEAALQEKIHECFSGPVICVDKDSRYYPNFWTDGYQAVYDTIAHMIEVHGMTDIAYLTGKKDHIHSKRRLDAYRASMEAHGLPVQENRIYYGDFWYFSGTAFAEELLRDRGHLPEAVVCANDPMAIGVAIGFQKAGLRIPEDIAVVGYGSSEEGRTSPCPITAPYIPGSYYGGYAIDSMLKLMNGEEPDEPKPKTRLFIGESCGCSKSRQTIKLPLRSEWTTGNSEGGFQSLHDYLKEDLLLTDNVEDFFRTVYDYIYFMTGLRRMDIYLDPQWKYPEQLVKNEFLVEGYPGRMLHVLSYDADNSGRCLVNLERMMDTFRMLDIEDKDCPEGHFFVPIFFENRTFGYAVFDYGNEPRSYDMVLRFWMNSVALGLEALRRTIALKCFSLFMTPDMEPQFRLSDEYSGRGFDDDNLSDDEREERLTVSGLLDANLFRYHFQPIVKAEDGEIFSYEALMRSNTDRKISPLRIIHHANGLGRLRDVERATFLNVLSEVDKRKEEFGDRKIFINSIPGIKLKEEDQEKVDNLLRKHSGNIVVELTEQAELEDDTLEALKNHLRDLGAGIAVDDYGTGYSNVSNLLRYMPDCVKIDRSLLSEIQNNTQKQHFVRNIIEFCHENDILALAEGVETTEELRMVIRLGADLIQGFYVARPSSEILQSVSSDMKMEICRFYRERVDGLNDQVYVAGKTPRITTNILSKEAKTTILVGEKGVAYRDLIIAGTPNVSSDIHIEVKEGYSGMITLENVTFSNKKQRPCIRMAEHCHLRLRLVGENNLRGGGILVPESSSLTLEGTGNLRIFLDGTEVFGIGNEIGKHHGDLDFYQEGEISIEAGGKTMIGIGSGLGGRIRINKGKYSLYMTGSYGMGIGSIDGDEDLLIHDCDLYMDCTLREGVCMGSINGSMKIEAMNTLFRLNSGGMNIAIIGTLKGKSADIRMHDLSNHISVRSDSSTAFGSLAGSSRIDFASVAIRYKSAGGDAFVFGGNRPDTTVTMDNSDFKARMSTGTVTKAPEENLTYTRSIMDVIIGEDALNLSS
ncbi:MAG: EAL domain-containing protein [Eubacterium sp.]|nr:EAL domain-containing protein [Eubacterium sp.]